MGIFLKNMPIFSLIMPGEKEFKGALRFKWRQEKKEPLGRKAVMYIPDYLNTMFTIAVFLGGSF